MCSSGELYPRGTRSAHTCRRMHGVWSSAPDRLSWLAWNNRGLCSSPFLLPLEKLLLAKNSLCVTSVMDFFLKYNMIVIMQLGQKRNQPLAGSCRGMMHLRGQDHTSPGQHNLNLFYSYNILNYNNCPKSQAVFITNISSGCCDIQLLFLSVAFLLAVEKGSGGPLLKGKAPSDS